MHARTDNVKTVYPPQTKFAGGMMNTGYTIMTIVVQCIASVNVDIDLSYDINSVYKHHIQ